mgnify:CR=1 FL=1
MQPSPNSNTCATSCPFGYEANDTLAACVQCSSTQVFFNKKCLDSCPYGYVKTESGSCGKCSNSNLIYYNHTCVSSCPLKTFRGYNPNINQYECRPCYLGCNTCVDETSSGCLSCSEGFFSFNNTCNTGCPSGKYANPQTRACEQCQPPCVTCSQPNDHSCTSCPPGNLLLNGTCVTNCPDDYYQSFLGDSEVFQVPICLPKLILTFSLSLTTDARMININFNYGIVNMIMSMSQKIQIEIANTQLDDVLFVLSPITESRIKFEYVGDQYYPPRSLLKVTIDLDTIDFNSNSYQQFRIVEKAATIQLKEIYPFSKAEKQFIASSSGSTNAGGSTVAAIQAVSSIAQGALSMSLIRMQMVGEVVQLLRFIAIQWPPNVAEYFATSNIDPSSIVIPVDFTGRINDPLEDRNCSMPRVFDEYEVSPFFTQNFSNELSNLLIWVSSIAGGSLILTLLKKGLKRLADRPDLKKIDRNKRKCLYHLAHLVPKADRLMNRIDNSTLMGFLLIFVLSIYQAGLLWSLLNIRYSSVLVEPPTDYTQASLALGIIFFIFNLALLAWVSTVLIKNLKHLTQTEDDQNPAQEERLKNYQALFDDFNRQQRLQVLFIPLSLVRSLLVVATISLMAFSPIAQITLVWSANTAFILYMIIYRPLKVKWMRIMTLIIEILTYGCITLAFVLGIVDHFANIDATTRDEVGFVFLALSISSTFAGGLLSAIQILVVAWSVYQYLQNRRRKKSQVHPVPHAELQLLAFTELRHGATEVLTPATQKNVGERDVVPLEGSPITPNNFDKRGNMKKSNRGRNMFEELRNLSPEKFEKIPHGKQLLESLQNWWDSYQEQTGSETSILDSVSLENPEEKKPTTLAQRFLARTNKNA